MSRTIKYIILLILITSTSGYELLVHHLRQSRGNESGTGRGNAIEEGKAKKMYVCFSSEKTRYGRSALHFILSKYFIWILHFLLRFSSFSSIFDNILLTIHNKMFRAGAKS